MKYIAKNHNYDYDVQSTIQIFYKNIKFEKINEVTPNDFVIYTEIKQNTVRTAIYIDLNLEIENIQNISNTESEVYFVKKSLFLLLKKYKHFDPEWGMFTGIRPIKRINSMLNAGYSFDQISDALQNKYYIKDDKIKLCFEIIKNQRHIVNNISDDFYSLYINIPFCATKCSYCSFTSFSYEKYKKQKDTEVYLEYLIKEIEYTKELMKDKILKSIYIGGGTPTSLDEYELEKLLSYLNKSFKINSLEEFTVEAGRPDTINKNKLVLMKKYGVSRISINTQTLNDITLKKIGRNHTSKDFFHIFDMAREIGHDNINVDVIIGLIDENKQDIISTLEDVTSLSPDSITIHTLAIKKGSVIRENKVDDNGNYQDDIEYENLKDMLNTAYEIINTNNYEPYYLYRQKNMLGNFENVGFSKNNKVCYYNIHIMEEKQTIIAVGAGASSKIIDLEKDKIETIFNLKGVEEYMARFDEMINRKKENINVY